MEEYHKIQTIFKRDEKNKFRTLLEGEFALPEFEYLKNSEWIFTEKVDGTNIRVMWNHETESITFGGKTDNAQIYSLLVTRLNNLFQTTVAREKFKEIFPDKSACLYGEGYGARIQKGGGNYRQDQDFVLIDVKIGHIFLKRCDIEDIAKNFNIDIVPIIGTGTLNDMVNMVRKGFNSRWGDFLAEGIVAKPHVELRDRMGHRIITKIKYKDFERK